MNILKISWLLAAIQPKDLACFYADLFQGSYKEGLSAEHWLVETSKVTIMEIYRPSLSRPFPKRGEVSAPFIRLVPTLNPLETLRLHVNAFLEKGAQLKSDECLLPFGAERWLKDPEGNPLLVFAPLFIE